MTKLPPLLRSVLPPTRYLFFRLSLLPPPALDGGFGLAVRAPHPLRLSRVSNKFGVMPYTVHEHKVETLNPKP